MQLKNPHKTTTDLLQSLFFPDWRRNEAQENKGTKVKTLWHQTILLRKSHTN